MRRTRRLAGRAAAALAVAWTALLVSPGSFAQGCAMCRTALNGDQDPLARAISLSAVFMLSMPFMIFASIAGWIVITIRRADRENAEGALPGPMHDGGEPPDSNLSA